jgi:pimeloyl-ACP methyl ester carboxylesterase
MPPASTDDAVEGAPAARELWFLPGASGNTDFWRPVAAQLEPWDRRRFWGWPGFGGIPADPAVRGIDDLIARVVGEIQGPVDLLAQSMGGFIALRAALEKPELVRRLVLSVTSGGIDVTALGARDWRPDYRQHFATVPSWFMDERRDLSAELGRIRAPVLLLWGDADPISPVAVGKRLADLLPEAELVVIEGGTHDLVFECALEVAPYIDRHLAGER